MDRTGIHAFRTILRLYGWQSREVAEEVVTNGSRAGLSRRLGMTSQISTVLRQTESLWQTSVQISFGVSPAAAAFAVGLRTPVDHVLLAFFVLAGLTRLARFNVTVA